MPRRITRITRIVPDGGDLTTAVEEASGARVDALHDVGGGDTSRAALAVLADGREVFVKSHHRAPDGFFEAEAHGLAWLAEAGALRLPAVVGTGRHGDVAVLVLERIHPGRPDPDHDEALGRGLAALHGAGAPSFGLDRPGFIGPLPQDNAPAGDWPTFFAERRVLPLVRRAVHDGRLPPEARGLADRLAARLPQLAGPPEPPARLHGDLWGGNAIVDGHGAPVLIDPSAHGGHREVDLAMMRLFGGFGPRVFAAYEDAFPLADGHAERVALWQLHPLLVHTVLFGGGYASSVLAALRRYA